MKTQIMLRNAECEIVKWALEVMPEYFAQLVDNGEYETMPTLPTLDGYTLVAGDEGPMADLLYRITTQRAVFEKETLLDQGKTHSFKKACRVRSALEHKLRRAATGADCAKGI